MPDGEHPDPNARILERRKANYAVRAAELRLQWRDGVFFPVDGTAASPITLAAEAKAERVFLFLLGELTRQERDVSPNVSKTYAPAVFAKHPLAEGVTSQHFAKAMERLLANNRIRTLTGGPPSRRYTKLVMGVEP